LLTGLYPHQAGMGHLDGIRRPHSQGTHGRLHDRCVTLAEVLAQAGYHTSIVGKWHLGQQHGTPPWDRGFRRTAATQFGELAFPTEQSPPATKVVYLDGRAVPADSPEVGVGEWYGTEMFTDWALKFVDDSLGQTMPFFLYVAHGAAHFPLKAPADVIARHRGRYQAGWDRLREERHRRQIEMGLVDPIWPLAPRPADVPAWDSLSDADRDRFDSIMAVYAAMIECIDTSVGRLVAGLRDRGVLDNTLILFLSDNGGNAESGPLGLAEGSPIGGPHSRVFLGMGWATLANTPFRRYKHFTHEGGIATPLIAHWPRGIAARGERRRQPGHVIDILPTCLEVAGAAMPATREGVAVQPLEGRSLVPAFHAETGALRRLFWEHEGNAAVSDGDTKLVRLGRDGPWELYDLVADRTESHDLAAAQPEKVRELTAAWEQWAERVHAVPMPDRRKTKPRTLRTPSARPAP
jgi:arylsulfatase